MYYNKEKYNQEELKWIVTSVMFVGIHIDPAVVDPKAGIGPGTPFESLPD
ncbi:hypothetical protein [endosymbiont 'TC1' of Trimyema compressum]